MTNAQKLTIKISEKESRVSEIRARLNSIEGLSESELTAEVRSEQSGLVGEFGTVDGELIALRNQHTAALIAEGNEEAEKRGDFGAGDGESAEVRALRSRVTITDYLNPAAGGAGLYGAAAELNSALEVPLVGKSGGVPIPWAVLAGPVQEVRQGENGGESRAFTDTGDYAGGIASRTILQRLFAPGIMDLLGVRMDSVPTGRTEWPLLTGGVAPDQAVEGAAAADAVSATFSTETLKPKRLTGKYEFTHEQAAQVPDIEQALRRDLADAVKSKMSALILAGDESTNAQEPDGFLTKIAAPGDPGAVAVFGDYTGLPSSAVDGLHAMMEEEVNVLLGVESYRHAATVYRPAGGGDESAIEALRRRCMRCAASAHVPVAAADIQDGNLVHAAGENGGGAMMRGDSVAAVWPTLEVIRDIYTKASQGVILTWVTLWDCEAAFRAGAYKRVAFQLA